MTNNNIRDTIITAFQVTKATKNKVPMLLLSNPGLAKTTIIKEIGQKYNYDVVSLIGSGFENNEILGFQVNEPGQESLITKNPTWFQKIIDNKKEGISSILFIDEISVCPSLVQGALYRLIFERTIGNGKMLPEDCVIISAGNYKENLPSYCDITSPALNRFCIINLCPDTWEDFLNEFSQDETERFANWPQFEERNNFDENLKSSRKAVKALMVNLFDCYSNMSDTSKGVLDIHNKELAGIFDGEYSSKGEVYNFISGRTYEYLQQSIAACATLKVGKKNPFIRKMVEGLIGAGTGSFTSEKQVSNYLKSTVASVAKIIESLEAGNTNENVNSKYDVFQGEKDIAQRVEKLSLFIDGDQFNSMDVFEAFKELFAQIVATYPIGSSSHQILDKMFGKSSSEEDRTVGYAKFSQDMLSIEQLIKIVKDNINNKEATQAVTVLENILEQYKFYAEFSC